MRQQRKVENGKTLRVEEDFLVPGTNVILEAGDRIRVLNEIGDFASYRFDDPDMAREIEIWIDNDQILDRQRQSIVQNLQKKMAKGTYDHSLAPKIWLYLVDAAAKSYGDAYMSGPVQSWFSKNDRRKLAQLLADRFLEESQGLDI